MGPDNTNYVVGFKKGELFALGSGSISAKSGPAPWDKAFLSHRWTLSSVLKYSIPVPDGVFTVKMLFAEIYFTKPGERTFDIYINGVTKTLGLDVVKSAGFMKGLVQTYPNVPSKKGVLEITLIKGVENPMISGIIIQGPGAGEKASGGGCSEESDLDPIDYESGYDHRSHSVPGGPYVATDFDSDGRAQIMFDGTGSHSHYSDPGPPLVTGKISAYKWTWFEVVGGKKIYKSNNNKSGKFTASFPVGVTKVSLEVVDSTGDVASDSTEVIVKDTTEDGAYCYYYNFGDSVGSTIPIGSGLNTFPKPTFGSVRPSVNFGTAAAFADTAFSGNAFAVRCRFFIDIPATGEYSYNIRHNGPFKLYHNGAVISQAGGNGMSATTKRTFARGLKAFQLLYFRPKNVSPLLTMSQGTTPLRAPMLQYDSSSILPVIDRLSKTKSTPSGGENIQIFGSGFINGVSVQFGDVVATNLIASNDKSLQVTVPEGFGWVDVTVSTNAGVSNAIRFLFASSDDEDYERPVLLGQASLFNKDGLTMNTGPVASLTYGPDGRLYMGSVHGTLTALQVNPRYQVEAKCVRTTPKYGGAVRSILGLAFSPFSNALKMYFTSSTLDWKKKSSLSFEDGWTNGKIETILWSNTYMEDNPSKGQVCASGRANLVTGLPVSNHDHGISKLVFLPDGSLLVSVGGFTNGGASYPGSKPPPGSTIKGDALGGVASNPLSAALVSCPWNQVTNIKYDQYVDPEKARIISGTECKLYATGLRNSFGMTVHTNGNLYATDNGPNAGFGDFSTDCVGGKVPAKNQPDSLFLVGRGRYHGHPNLNRKQCIRNPPTRVKPLINLKSATTGIIEYRSNSFGGGIKGNLYISKFASQGDGLLGEVKLKGNGGRDGVDYAPEFRNFSGVSLVEGPRGEMVMSRVWRTEVVIAYPVYRAPELTFMIGVHPKQGPSFGGTKVLISGHNFGESPSAKFGGTPCTNVVSLNDESFTCITPAKGKNEKVTVIVTGRAGVSPTYGSDYWYF